MVVFLLGGLLVSVSLEKRLYIIAESLSHDPKFVKTLAYFMLVNVQVILALFLGYLLFRQIAALVIERRRGMIGAHLKTKLISAFVFFALVPSGLIVFVSTQFITESFSRWLSSQSSQVASEMKAAAGELYDAEHQRVIWVAKAVMSQLSGPAITPPFRDSSGDHSTLSSSNVQLSSRQQLAQEARLDALIDTYNLSAIKLYDTEGFPVLPILRPSWPQQNHSSPGSFHSSNYRSNYRSKHSTDQEKLSWVAQRKIPYIPDDDITRWILQLSEELSAGATAITLPQVTALQKGRQCRVIAQVSSGFLQAAPEVNYVVIEMTRSLNGLDQFHKIQAALERLDSSSQILKLNYIVLMLLMLLIIVFCGVWLSVHVARGLVTPLSLLSRATREVAHGNYRVSLPNSGEDETAQLIEDFNGMIHDLQAHELESQKAQHHLEEINAELREKSSNLEVVLSSITSAVITLDSSGGLVEHMNPAAEKLLGTSGMAVQGQLPGEAFAHLPQLADLWHQIACGETPGGIYAGGSAGVSASSSLESPLWEDREAYPALLVRVAQIRDEGRTEALGTVVVIDDVADQILAQKSRAWRDVAARIAHEIKNPITPIKLNAQRLERRFANSFEHDDDRDVFVHCLRGIIAQVDTLKDLVHEFTRSSRLPEANKQKSDIIELINEVYYFFKETYDIPHWQWRSTAEVYEMRFDRAQIRRALMNLLVNSVEAITSPDYSAYSQANHRTSITLEFTHDSTFQSDQVKIIVTDEGPGMPADMLEQMSDHPTSTKPYGSGLGLGIVRRIAADHGGKLVLSPVEPHGLRAELSLSTKV